MKLYKVDLKRGDTHHKTLYVVAEDELNASNIAKETDSKMYPYSSAYVSNIEIIADEYGGLPLTLLIQKG